MAPGRIEGLFRRVRLRRGERERSSEVQIVGRKGSISPTIILPKGEEC